MQITDTQLAVLIVSLSALGQTPLADNDLETLQTLDYLLEEASKNVKRAMIEKQATAYD